MKTITMNPSSHAKAKMRKKVGGRTRVTTPTWNASLVPTQIPVLAVPKLAGRNPLASCCRASHASGSTLGLLETFITIYC